MTAPKGTVSVHCGPTPCLALRFAPPMSLLVQQTGRSTLVVIFSLKERQLTFT